MKHRLRKLLRALVFILIFSSVGVFSYFAYIDKLPEPSDDAGAYLEDPRIDTPTLFPGVDNISDNTALNAAGAEVPETQDVLLKANISPLKIRSGPGTGYAVVGSINSGDMVPYVAEENSKWYKTLYKGKTAYVSTSYTKIVKFDKASEKIEQVIDETKKLLGYPYIYGAERYHWGAPNAHLNGNFVMGKFDCSSLTQYAFYKGANIILNTTTRTQVKQGKPVEKQYLKRGDLMFFTNSSRSHLSGTERIGHVAIYLGDNYIIHTASDYAVIEQITAARWRNYITSRRFID